MRLSRTLSVVSLLLLLPSLVVSCKKDEEEDEKAKFTLKGAGSSTSLRATADGVDPNFLSVKLYKFSVSKEKTCTDPITVYENDSPDAEDMLAGPEFGTGELDEGSYPCVIMEISDVLKFQPEETTGVCEKNEDFTLNVCRSGKSKLADGTSVTCDSGVDRVAVYLSTLSTITDGAESQDIEACVEDYDKNCSAFLPPTNDLKTRGLKLGSALEVSGDTTGTFIVDGSGQISSGLQEGEEACDMGPPLFTFE